MFCFLPFSYFCIILLRIMEHAIVQYDMILFRYPVTVYFSRSLFILSSILQYDISISVDFSRWLWYVEKWKTLEKALWLYSMSPYIGAKMRFGKWKPLERVFWFYLVSQEFGEIISSWTGVLIRTPKGVLRETTTKMKRVFVILFSAELLCNSFGPEVEQFGSEE